MISRGINNVFNNNRYRSRSLKTVVKSSMHNNEYDKEAFMSKYKSNLKKSLQENIITPKMLKKTINRYWINVSDVSLSVFLKDNQYHLDINMREDVDDEMKNKVYNADTFDDSIDEVLFQLNKWQIGQFTINTIDTYGLLMDVDKSKTVSIPLSVYITRLEEFE